MGEISKNKCQTSVQRIKKGRVMAQLVGKFGAQE